MESVAPNSKEKRVQEVLLEINRIRQDTHVMGGNDFEPSAFEKILSDLEAGRCTPETALAEAHKIINSKNDYH